MVPIVNENDTTATDEISFGDNDFLAAQVALLLDARLLVFLTNVEGLLADPAPEPDAQLISEVEELGELDGLEIDDRPPPSAPAGCAARSPQPRWPARPGSRQ